MNIESKDELKEININRICYYFDDIKIEDFNDILIDQKRYENVLIYNISYKTLIDANLCVLGSIK